MANAKKSSATSAKAQKEVKVIASGLMTRDEVRQTVKAEREKNRETKVAEREAKKATSKASKKTESTAESRKSDLVNIINAIGSTEEYNELLKLFKEQMTVCGAKFKKPGQTASQTTTAKVEEPVKTESKRKEYKQVTSVTAKVRKDLGLKLERFIKKDGGTSKYYLLTGKENDSTKYLLNWLTEKFKDVAQYRGWAHGYFVHEKHIAEFSKAIGIKVA